MTRTGCTGDTRLNELFKRRA